MPVSSPASPKDIKSMPIENGLPWNKVSTIAGHGHKDEGRRTRP